MAGADAVMTLSPNESLSLATLEGQAQAVPIIVRAGNAVLEGHIKRGNGGVAVDGYEEFAAALDDLWSDPAHWQSLGRAGREYVRRSFGDAARYQDAWQAAVIDLDRPLAVRMVSNGLRKARSADRVAWRKQFEALVDAVLEAPARPRIDGLRILPRAEAATASLQQSELLIPVRLTNYGQYPAVADGPGRTELVARVLAADGISLSPETMTPVPCLVVPGRSVAGMIRVAVPAAPGEYAVVLGLRRMSAVDPAKTLCPAAAVKLSVVGAAASGPPAAIPANLEPVLRAATAAQELPVGYVDVSEGRLGRVKRWIKHKLLHNFQTGYVDVLSRQQSAFNRQMLTALAELGDGQAALTHAAASSVQPPGGTYPDELTADVRRLKRRLRRLEGRLEHMESSCPPIGLPRRRPPHEMHRHRRGRVHRLPPVRTIAPGRARRSRTGRLHPVLPAGRQGSEPGRLPDAPRLRT